MASTESHGAGAAAAMDGRRLGPAVAWGALAGVGASLVMALYAMVAAWTYQNTGFFTPLYHIAATFAAPDTMMTSVGAAADGDSFTFVFGPAVLGALIHMITGAVYGAVFGVVAALLRLSGGVLVAAATVWGLIVFALSTWIGLPVAAALFGGADPIRNMATMVGYPTFVAEHLVFGLVLGLLLRSLWRRKR